MWFRGYQRQRTTTYIQRDKAENKDTAESTRSQSQVELGISILYFPRRKPYARLRLCCCLYLAFTDCHPLCDPRWFEASIPWSSLPLSLTEFQSIRRRPADIHTTMLLELIFSSFAVFNLVLLTPMLSMSPRKIGLAKKKQRKCKAR